jgi:hypothetical protein
MSPQRDCPACHGSGVAEDPVTTRPLGRCTACRPAGPGRRAKATAIRGLLIERAGQPGEFTVEDVLRWTPLAGSNAVGGIVAQLASQGVIVRVGTRPAERSSRHRGMAGVWMGARWRREQLQLEETR